VDWQQMIYDGPASLTDGLDTIAFSC